MWVGAKSSVESSRFSDKGGRVLGGEDNSALGILGADLGAAAFCVGTFGGVDLGGAEVLVGALADVEGVAVLAGVEE